MTPPDDIPPDDIPPDGIPLDDIPLDTTASQAERAVPPIDAGKRREVGPESEVRGGPEAPADKPTPAEGAGKQPRRK